MRDYTARIFVHHANQQIDRHENRSMGVRHTVI